VEDPSVPVRWPKAGTPTTSCPPLPKKTVEWISKQKKDQPFFAYLAFNSPHYPIVPNKEFHGKSKAGYYGDFVIETDAMVGKVLKALKKHGFAENTLVIFSADNGPETHAFERLEKFDQWSSGKYRGVKRDIYEGGHRVPFIVRWPGKIKPASISDEVVSQVDLASTFAKIIDYPIEKKEAIDSYNLLPVLRGEKYQKPLRIATVQNTSPKKFAIRQGDWILIDAPTGAAKKEQQSYLDHFGLEPYGKGDQGLLFNLKEDPQQSDNLYAQHPVKVKKMRSLLQSYLDGKPCAPYEE
jgi:arylsulfatase A-like enzyme